MTNFNLQNAKTNSQLRKILDNDDTFLWSGHQIIKLRRHQHKRPEWSKHEDQIRGLIMRAFPRCNENSEIGLRQRERAGRWARVIQLYYVMGYTYSQVAEELEQPLRRIHKVIDHIRMASKGRRANYSGMYAKKRGAIKTSFRETCPKPNERRSGCAGPHVSRAQHGSKKAASVQPTP